MSSDVSRLPPFLRHAVSAELKNGEKVVYAGMPDWRAEAPQLLMAFVFGAFWSMLAFPAAFFVWAETLGFRPAAAGKAMGAGFGAFFSIFLIPFVVIGIALLASPFVAIVRSRRTAHLVTDMRLMNVVTGGRSNSVDSFELSAINFLRRRDGKRGRGSLTIGYGVEIDSEGDSQPLTAFWPGIPDVRRAETVIRSLAKWAR